MGFMREYAGGDVVTVFNRTHTRLGRLIRVPLLTIPLFLLLFWWAFIVAYFCMKIGLVIAGIGYTFVFAMKLTYVPNGRQNIPRSEFSPQEISVLNAGEILHHPTYGQLCLYPDE